MNLGKVTWMATMINHRETVNAEISDAVMRKMGLDLVEKPTLTMNHIQRLGGCMADSKE